MDTNYLDVRARRQNSRIESGTSGGFDVCAWVAAPQVDQQRAVAVGDRSDRFPAPGPVGSLHDRERREHCAIRVRGDVGPAVGEVAGDAGRRDHDLVGQADGVG